MQCSRLYPTDPACIYYGIYNYGWPEAVFMKMLPVLPGVLVSCRLNDLPDIARRAELPAITITSYEMMKRLTCAACQKLQGAAAAAAARAAAARQVEAAAATAAATTAAAASDAAAADGSKASGGAATQASGGRGRGGGSSGRGRGGGRMAPAPVQDSVLMGSEEYGRDTSDTAGGPGGKPGGVAGRRCKGCTGPGVHTCQGLVPDKP